MATRKSSSKSINKNLKTIEALCDIRSAQVLVDEALKNIGAEHGGELDISIDGEDVLLLRTFLKETKSRLASAARAAEAARAEVIHA